MGEDLSDVFPIHGSIISKNFFIKPNHLIVFCITFSIVQHQFFTDSGFLHDQ